MVDLIGKRKYFFALSILIILIGVIGYFINGVQLDIQFQGGTIIKIQTNDENYDTNEVQDLIQSIINKKVIVQKSSTYNVEEDDKIYLMVLNIASDDTLTVEERTKVINAIRENYNVVENAEITVDSVEPFIGKEIRRNALYAVFWASLFIILYVWWRFKAVNGLSAGVFGVVALIHDVFVMVAVYILFKIPLNESFIAATLTVIGYSMNDTVIIYDRIRENRRLLRKVSIADLVNRSVVQTLNRSINTVVTTLISIIVVFIFASVNNIQSLREFTFPLIIGFVSGVYSSIFIASTLYVVWMEYKEKRKLAAKATKTKAKSKA